jgi:hypothetical protein
VDVLKYVIRYPALFSTHPGFIDASRYVSQPPRNQTSQGQPDSNFADGSGRLFTMYVKMAEEEDNKMTERWQKDADGILIFVSPLLVSMLQCG